MTPLQRQLYRHHSVLLYGAVLCLIALGVSIYLNSEAEALQVNSEALCGLTDVVCEGEAGSSAPQVWFDVYPVQAEILRQTKAANWNEAQQKIALDIAYCESGFNPLAKNNGSTATGTFQFLSGTWQHIGSPGDRLDYVDNIAAFVETVKQYL